VHFQVARAAVPDGVAEAQQPARAARTTARAAVRRGAAAAGRAAANPVAGRGVWGARLPRLKWVQPPGSSIDPQVPGRRKTSASRRDFNIKAQYDKIYRNLVEHYLRIAYETNFPAGWRQNG